MAADARPLRVDLCPFYGRAATGRKLLACRTNRDVHLAEFFRGVDLLLAECSLPEELVGDNHLSPERLAEIATAAEASRLAVTHVYPQLGRLDVPELLRAAGYEGEITMVTDGLEMIV